MYPVSTKKRKHYKNDSKIILSNNEFKYLYGGMTYMGGYIDKIKISNRIIEKFKRNTV